MGPPNRITLREETSDSELTITSPMLTPPSGPSTPVHQASEEVQKISTGSVTPIHQSSLQKAEPATDSAQNTIDSKHESDNANKCESDSNSACETDTLLGLVLETNMSNSPSRERTNSGGSPSSYETAS